MGVPIDGFPDYCVNEHGEIYSIKSNRFLNPSLCSGGYLNVELFAPSGKSTRFLVHRLVASAFIPNPLNLPQVNHKDEDKTNNRVSNLEWCTPAYNMNYGTRAERQRAHTNYSTEIRKETARKNGKAVSRKVIDLTTGNIYASIKEASRKTKINPNHIGEVCQGKRNSAGKRYWKYVEGE